MSVGSKYRLSLAGGPVLGPWSRATHLDCAFPASPSIDNRIHDPRFGFTIRDREQPSSEFVRREASREHFEWRIETPSRRMRKPRALAQPIGRQEVSDEFPGPRRRRQAADASSALGERPPPP